MKIREILILILILSANITFISNSHGIVKGNPKNPKTVFGTSEKSPFQYASYEITQIGYPVDQIWLENESIILFSHGFIKTGNRYSSLAEYSDYDISPQSGKLYVLYALRLSSAVEEPLYSKVFIYSDNGMVNSLKGFYSNISAGYLDEDAIDDIVLWSYNGSVTIIYSNSTIIYLKYDNVSIMDLFIWNNSIYAFNVSSYITLIRLYPSFKNLGISFDKLVGYLVKDGAIEIYNEAGLGKYNLTIFQDLTFTQELLSFQHFDKMVLTEYGYVFYDDTGVSFYNGSEYTLQINITRFFYVKDYLFILNNSLISVYLNTLNIQSKTSIVPEIVYFNDTYLAMFYNGSLFSPFDSSRIGRLEGVGSFNLYYYKDRIIISSLYDVTYVDLSGVSYLNTDAEIDDIYLSENSTIIKLKNGSIMLVNGTIYNIGNVSFAFLDEENQVLSYGFPNGTVIINGNKYDMSSSIVFISKLDNGDFVIASLNASISGTLAIANLTIWYLNAGKTYSVINDISFPLGINDIITHLKMIVHKNVVAGSIELVAYVPALFKYINRVVYFVINDTLYSGSDYPKDGHILPFVYDDTIVFANSTVKYSTANNFILFKNNTFQPIIYDNEFPLSASYASNSTDIRIRWRNTTILLPARFVIDTQDRLSAILFNGAIKYFYYLSDHEAPQVVFYGEKISDDPYVEIGINVTDNFMIAKVEVELSFYHYIYNPESREFTFFKIFNLSDGTYNLSVFVEDVFGNKNVLKEIILVDTEPPIIVVNYPENNSFINESILKPDFIIKDTSQVNVTILVDGKIYTGEHLNDGLHIMEIIAEDEFGRKEHVSIEFTIDTTPPTITLLSPSKEYINSTTIKIEFYVNEKSDLKAFIDGNKISTNTTVRLDEGVHILVIEAIDRAGNMVRFEYTFIVDVTSPIVRIEPSNTTVLEGEIVLEINATDNFGIDHILLYTSENRTYNKSKIKLNLTEGLYEFLVVVIDKAGNVNITHFYLDVVKGIKILGKIVPIGHLVFVLTFSLTFMLFITYKKRQILRKRLKMIFKQISKRNNLLQISKSSTFLLQV